MTLRLLFLVAGYGLLVIPTSAEVTLASLFQDGAVLQRDEKISVWGAAEPGEAIRISYRAWSADTVADADGRWRVAFGPLAPGPAAELVVRGREQTLTRTNVVVGDVWLCSGQSNMQFAVRDALGGEAERNLAEFPPVRQFRVGFATASTPASTAQGAWRTAARDTVGDFTAVGYFFARDWQRHSGVPVGLINASVGGTAIESWIAADTLRADRRFIAVQDRWNAVLASHPAKQQDYRARLAAWESATGRERMELARRGSRKPQPPIGPGHRDEPGSLFHAMIAPLAGYGIRGVLWYQGEANATRADEYAELFTALIRDWRARWHEPALPFYFVQLAGYADPNPTAHWPALREAQARALTLPATGMVTAIDVGEQNDIHPANKATVGRRLAALAVARATDPSTPSPGPALRHSQIFPDGTVRLTFDRPLARRDETPRGFIIAGDDRHFYPATTRVEGDTVIVTSDAVPAPVAVRYAWSGFPDATLADRDGQPAPPFRTDDWPP